MESTDYKQGKQYLVTNSTSPLAPAQPDHHPCHPSSLARRAFPGHLPGLPISGEHRAA